jgi:peptidoglycan/LPS O-acetylase OafA/YrhL
MPSLKAIQKPEHLSHPKYRADIDGLRAIAVLSVICFHAFPLSLKGGFIGVDIFFVISGYLISTIIFDNLEHHTFSFIEFYSRRIKRIFPALLLVLIACLIFGWFALLADEYKQLGKHIAGGAGFISNFIFWNESGYFDNTADTKPLLHLWTLGIEEQFYIVWPLLLWAAWKKKFNLLTISIVIAIFSFVLNVKGIRADAIATFYSPQTRFWELLIGSILAYVTLYKPNLLATQKQKLDGWLGALIWTGLSKENLRTLRNAQSLLGAALIGYGLLILNKDRHFPGTWALLPTLGAALIISAGTQAWFNRIVLSNRLLVWVGLISFPLYLWHWPLLSFACILEGEASLKMRSIALLVSIILAWLTYQLIEKPIRLKAKSNITVYILITLILLVGSGGYVLYKNDGLQGYGFRSEEKNDFTNYFENSLPKQNYFEETGMSKKYRADCEFYDFEKHRISKVTRIPKLQIDISCYTPNTDPKKKNILFVLGDSHAQQLYFGLKNNIPADWQILIVASSGCSPTYKSQEEAKNDYCQKSNQFALKTIQETKPNVVIVAQAHGHKFDELNELGDLLLKSGVNKIIFTGPVPHWKRDLPKIILRKLWGNTPERTFVDIDEKIMAENINLKRQFLKSKSLVFIDVMAVFCNDSGCLTRIGDDKKTGITSWDYGHLTPIASDYLAKNVLIKNILNTKSSGPDISL